MSYEYTITPAFLDALAVERPGAAALLRKWSVTTATVSPGIRSPGGQRHRLLFPDLQETSDEFDRQVDVDDFPPAIVLDCSPEELVVRHHDMVAGGWERLTLIELVARLDGGERLQLYGGKRRPLRIIRRQGYTLETETIPEKIAYDTDCLAASGWILVRRDDCDT